MKVILYSTGCPKCKVLKAKLDSKSIEYTINDNVDAMLEMGISEVPVLSVNGELMRFADAVSWINNQ